MSAANESNGRVERPDEGTSVLSNLPRTRPQRATARRAASRRSGEAEVAVKTTIAPAAPGKPSSPPKPAKARARNSGAPKRAARPRPAPAGEPVPRQGFESDGDRVSGSVSPPGGIELLASAAELLGELAKAGVGTGERLLRDVLGRLPGS